jgi:hypothetical protein
MEWRRSPLTPLVPEPRSRAALGEGACSLHNLCEQQVTALPLRCVKQASPRRRSRRALGTTTEAPVRPDAWHPVHRHDVAVCELAIDGSSRHRRCRNEADAAVGQSRVGPLLAGEGSSALVGPALPRRSPQSREPGGPAGAGFRSSLSSQASVWRAYPRHLVGRVKHEAANQSGTAADIETPT